MAASNSVDLHSPTVSHEGILEEVALQSRRRAKRVKRACDKCSTSKKRCVRIGETCQQCLEYGFACEDSREHKKRGRVARSGSIANPAGRYDPSTLEQLRRAGGDDSSHRRGSASCDMDDSTPMSQDVNHSSTRPLQIQYNEPDITLSDQRSQPHLVATSMSLHANNDSNSSCNTDICVVQQGDAIPGHVESMSRSQSYMNNWPHDEYSMPSGMGGHRDDGHENTMYQSWNDLEIMPQVPSPLATLQARTPQRVPALPSLSSLALSTSYGSPSDSRRSRGPAFATNGQRLFPWDHGCRYPVLRPLLPYIASFITPELACELLDLYFTEPSCSLFESSSPYVVAQVFRKKTFLCEHKPRKTSPALLAAMIWVAAQTSDAEVFKSGPRARSRICNEIYSACETLMSLEDKERSNQTHIQQINKTQDRRVIFEDMRHFDGTETSQRIPGTLDDVLTYTLIGTVISGSEARKESLRWWTKAWTLGKELNLSREQGENEARKTALLTRDFGSMDLEGSRPDEQIAIEESREERRRTWWLLYIADRHLALCYHAPLHILDAECSIYQPLDEATWQDLDIKLTCGTIPRFLGPYTTITGSGIFEYFLPLMAILGDIVDVHNQGRHPRLGHLNLEPAVLQIECLLENCAESLNKFEESVMIEFPDMDLAMAYSPSQGNLNSERAPRPSSPEHARLKTVIAYSKHLIHVLHVLLHGCWDPISMLDGADWITPNSFAKCATHAISAANAVADILKFDPELSFMPYLFGIYLLHGSFILLIFADRMDMATSETITQACETTIKAHEVCVATLNTEYQRTFRKVMRSAIYSVRCMKGVDIEQHKARRREFLSLYRWAKTGKGLAI